MTNNIKRPAAHARTMEQMHEIRFTNLSKRIMFYREFVSKQWGKKYYPVVSTWTLISMPEGSFVLA